MAILSSSIGFSFLELKILKDNSNSFWIRKKERMDKDFGGEILGHKTSSHEEGECLK